MTWMPHLVLSLPQFHLHHPVPPHPESCRSRPRYWVMPVSLRGGKETESESFKRKPQAQHIYWEVAEENGINRHNSVISVSIAAVILWKSAAALDEIRRDCCSRSNAPQKPECITLHCFCLCWGDLQPQVTVSDWRFSFQEKLRFK